MILSIPEDFVFRIQRILKYRCLLIGRLQYLYTIEHAVENIAYHKFQSIKNNIAWPL